MKNCISIKRCFFSQNNENKFKVSIHLNSENITYTILARKNVRTISSNDNNPSREVSNSSKTFLKSNL